MTILEEVNSIIKECPHLQHFYKELNIEDKEDKSNLFKLEEIGTEPLVKKYVNGDSINQIEFMFTTGNEYDEELITQLQSSEFNKELIEYLNKNIKNELFKEDDSREVLKLQVTSNGEVKEGIISGMATYEIKFKLVYFKEEK